MKYNDVDVNLTRNEVNKLSDWKYQIAGTDRSIAVYGYPPKPSGDKSPRTLDFNNQNLQKFMLDHLPHTHRYGGETWLYLHLTLLLALSKKLVPMIEKSLGSGTITISIDASTPGRPIGTVDVDKFEMNQFRQTAFNDALSEIRNLMSSLNMRLPREHYPVAKIHFNVR